MCHSDMWISEDNLWESCPFCGTQGLNSHFQAIIIWCYLLILAVFELTVFLSLVLNSPSFCLRLHPHPHFLNYRHAISKLGLGGGCPCIQRSSKVLSWAPLISTVFNFSSSGWDPPYQVPIRVLGHLCSLQSSERSRPIFGIYTSLGASLFPSSISSPVRGKPGTFLLYRVLLGTPS